jgi:hypothetical protein
MHRFLSRGDKSADLARAGVPACGSEAPANVLYGTLRRPTECNAGRADDLVAAVENLCIVRAKHDNQYFQEPRRVLSKTLAEGVRQGTSMFPPMPRKR